jgi:hypothetical protein
VRSEGDNTRYEHCGLKPLSEIMLNSVVPPKSRNPEILKSPPQ